MPETLFDLLRRFAEGYRTGRDRDAATDRVGGVQTIVVALQGPINHYLDERNAQPMPFVRAAFASSILAKLAHLAVAKG